MTKETVRDLINLVKRGNDILIVKNRTFRCEQLGTAMQQLSIEEEEDLRKLLQSESSCKVVDQRDAQEYWDTLKLFAKQEEVKPMEVENASINADSFESTRE